MAQLNFSIALNLLTDKFKNGVSSVKSGFASIKVQVMTFVAALRVADLSLSGFVSKLVDTARETNRVTTALKNISPNIDTYVKSQKWLIDLSEKYGVEVNSLTGEFAKFTAAGNIMNMPLKDQKKIFESVARACSGFALTADDTNSVFLALSQMMGKGKIQAQELRLQMGEKLPVAIQAMALAAGGSVGNMEKMMKDGKLLSKDVLPKFADALNKLIPNVNTDNLETSVKRMDNAFTGMVKNTTVQQKYKSLIDWITSALRTASDNIKNIISGFWSVVIGYIVSKGAEFILTSAKQAKTLEAQAYKSNTALLNATKERIAAEVAVERSGGSLQSKMRLSAALQAEELAKKDTRVALDKRRNDELIKNANLSSDKLISITKQRLAAEEEMKLANTALINAKTEEETQAAQKRIKDADASYFKYIKKESVAAEEARVAAINASSAEIPGKWEKACNTMKTATARFAVAVKSILSSMVPMAFFTIIAMIGTKLYNTYERSKQIKEMLSDAKEGIKNAGNTEDVQKLKNELEFVNNIKNNLSARKNVLKDLNTQLNTNFSIDAKSLIINGNINGKVKERIELLKKAAIAEHSIEGELNTADKRRNVLKQMSKDLAGFRDIRKRTGARGDANAFNGALKNDLNELGELAKTKSYYHKLGQTNLNNKNNNVTIPQGDTTNNKKHKKTELERLEEEYYKEYIKLRIQLKYKEITQSKYNKEYDELNVKTLSELRGNKITTGSFYGLMLKKANNPISNPNDSLKDIEKEYSDKMKVNEKLYANHAITQQELSDATKNLASEYMQQAQSIKNIGNKANGFLAKLKSDVALSDLSGVENRYSEEVGANRKMLEAGLMSQEDYNKAVLDLSLQSAKSAASIENIGRGADKFVGNMQKTALSNLNIPSLKDKKADTTFDYRKQKNESNEEDLQRVEEYIQILKDKAKELGDTISTEIDKKIVEAESKEKVLKLAVLKQDIKDIQKELSRNSWDGIKDAVSGVENVSSSVENLTSTLKSNTGAWKKLMALWDTFSSVVDTINSVSDTIENLTELTTKLGMAKKTEAAVSAFSEDDGVNPIKQAIDLTDKLSNAKKIEAVVDTATTTKKVANAATGTAAVIGSAVAEKVANTTTVGGNMAAAGSEVIKQNAKIPIVGIALAAAGLTAILALMHKLPKFATGGIIDGNSTNGDNMLARVNSGEMVLNKSQQSNLFKAINSGRLGGATNVNIGVDKVRGSDIYLSVKNYMKSTGKKL